MKKHLPTIMLIFVFLIGLTVLMYPAISDYVNSRNQSRAIAGYQQQVDLLEEKDYQEILAAAQEYNRNHKANDFSISNEAADTQSYRKQLSINGSSVIGSLTIDKLNIRLAIYHNIDDSVLQVGIGHLPQTSLPIGGEGTHAVISGHTGLPSAELLSDLDRMEIGDVFKISVLNETYAYRVDQISVVLPDELDELALIPGRDLVTIITCTPYGVNSHRLLVRGTAIGLDEIEEGINETNIPSATGSHKESAFDTYEWILMITIPVIIILLVVLLVSSRKKKK